MRQTLIKSWADDPDRKERQSKTTKHTWDTNAVYRQTICSKLQTYWGNVNNCNEQRKKMIEFYTDNDIARDHLRYKANEYYDKNSPSKSFRCIQTGEIFVNQHAAARKLNIKACGINLVLHNIQQTTKGYSFEFINI